MQYGITQCFLPPGTAGSGDFPAFTPASKLVLDLATLDRCKAELTWVILVVISQDSLPAKDGQLSQKNNWAVSWPGIEPATGSRQ